MKEQIKTIWTRFSAFLGRSRRFAEANTLVLFLLFCTGIVAWIAAGSAIELCQLESENKALHRTNEALRPKCPCECEAAPKP